MAHRAESRNPLASHGLKPASAHYTDFILWGVMTPELDCFGIRASLRRRRRQRGFIYDPSVKGEQPVRARSNLGADGYLSKHVTTSDVPTSIHSRLERAAQQVQFKPDLTSSAPLERAFELSPRVAEMLLWLAQGKTNAEIPAQRSRPFETGRAKVKRATLLLMKSASS